MPQLPSPKRLLIDKANSGVVIIVAVASFVTIFGLVASKALLSQQAYQSRVTADKERAVTQLKANIGAVADLQKAYQAFVSTPENVLGGDPKGTGDKDGDNARLILDALPSKYDFPALTTSLEKLLSSQNFKIESIQGTDDEIHQEANGASPNPQPIIMPFQITFGGTYASMEFLLASFEKSIRPIQIQSIQLGGTDADMHATISARTFYQPAKNLSITTRTIQ
jgi:hypothetical protein